MPPASRTTFRTCGVAVSLALMLAGSLTSCARLAGRPTPGREASSRSAGPGAATPGVPAAARNVACPAIGIGAPALPAGQRAGPLPPGFSTLAVVRCVELGTRSPDGVLRSHMRKEVAITGLFPLLAALREPSASVHPGGLQPACLVPATSRPRLVLIGRNGQLARPRIPVGLCGEPIEQVLASLRSLHWITLSTAPEPGPAVTITAATPPAVTN